MRMFGYYALHSFINQLKKIFRKQMLIFILICAVVGGLIGFGAGSLSNIAEKRAESEAETIESVEGREDAAEASEENSEDEIALPEELDLLTEEEAAFPLTGRQVFELVLSVLILGILIYEALSADRNGGKIFLPADVNLLFPSPLRPQTVLFFRLMMQAGAALFASIYLIFQVPSLMRMLDLSAPAALSIILTWALLLFTGRFLQVLLYTVTKTHPALKKYLPPAIYCVLGAIAVSFLLFTKLKGLTFLEAANAFFNARGTRLIPYVGWLKGIPLYAAEGDLGGFLLSLGLSFLGIAVLLIVIRRVKADFYEDAMARSEQTAELMESVQSGRTIIAGQKKKPRSERINREAFHHGQGASVFFFRPLVNRFRFARFGIFTKTCGTYLVSAVLLAAVLRILIGTDTVLPIVFVLAAFVFYRAMGNPLEEDLKMDFFRLTPESSLKKVFCSIAAGAVNCVLDLLPALIIAPLLLPANPLKALVWLPFIAAIDFFATSTNAFLSLAIPPSVDKTVRQIITILFLYFGLIPAVGIMAVGLIFDHRAAAALICAALHIGLGFLFCILAASFLEAGAGSSNAHPETAGDPAEARRAFSAAGIALALSLLLTAAVQSVLSMILGEATQNVYVLFAMTFLPVYLLGMPLALWLLRRGQAREGSGGGILSAAGVRFTFGKWLSAYFIGLFLMYTGNLVGISIVSLLTRTQSATDLNPLLNIMNGRAVILQLLVTCVIAPIFEEAIFRYGIISKVRPYGERLAIVFSAFCFGLYHGNLQQFLYATLLGLVLGYVYLRTGKLRHTIALHMAINLTGNAATLLLQGVDESTPSGNGSLALGDADMIREMLASPRMILLVIYLLFIVAAFLIGLVLFIVNLRRVHFEAAPKQLPKGTAFRAAVLNPGMLFFIIAAVAMIVLVLVA